MAGVRGRNAHRPTLPPKYEHVVKPEPEPLEPSRVPGKAPAPAPARAPAP